MVDLLLLEIGDVILTESGANIQLEQTIATKTFTIDAVLKQEFTKTFTIDTQLVNQFTRTFTIDASVRKSQNQLKLKTKSGTISLNTS